MAERKISSKAEAAFKRVTEQFMTGDLSPLVTIIKTTVPEYLQSHKWSLRNRTLAYMQTGTLDCRTKKQWAELGRYQKAGSKAAYLWRPFTVLLYEDGKPKLDDKGNKMYKKVPGKYWPFFVFSVNDTDGDELPYDLDAEFKPVELPPLADVAERLGCKVVYEPIEDRNAYATYNPKDRRIRLATKTPAEFYHELGHAAHDTIEKLRGGQLPEQEIVAEFVAAVLMQLYGEDYTGNAWKYITMYAPDDPQTAIKKALGTVEDVLAVILNGGDQKGKVFA